MAVDFALQLLLGVLKLRLVICDNGTFTLELILPALRIRLAVKVHRKYRNYCIQVLVATSPYISNSMSPRRSHDSTHAAVYIVISSPCLGLIWSHQFGETVRSENFGEQWLVSNPRLTDVYHKLECQIETDLSI